jgi:hypothetical protein
MLSTPLPLVLLLVLVLLLQLGTLAVLLLWLRAYLRDRFGQLLVVLRELQGAVQLLGDQLGALQRSSAEQTGRIADLVRISQAATRLLEADIIPAQEKASAEVRELRQAVALLEREVAAQAHRVLSHLAWEEVERYVAEDQTPEAEKDFFRQIRARRSE